jgi:hypothetical protein
VVHVTAIIAAGGRGVRLGGARPKQFLALGGRPILQRSVDAFVASDRIAEVVVALPPDLAAGIPAALQGRWGLVPADCTSTRGDAKGLLTISPTTLKFYESLGTLGKIRTRTASTLRADFSFSGEGMTWTRDETLSVSGNKLTRTERGGDEPGSGGPFTYTRC